MNNERKKNIKQTVNQGDSKKESLSNAQNLEETTTQIQNKLSEKECLNKNRIDQKCVSESGNTVCKVQESNCYYYSF